jgi:CelD/BcsL family acetyltransferase involved in cellulose biosynthesis
VHGNGISAIDVQVVADAAALAGQAQAWNRLLERRPRALPFGSYAWMSAFFEHRLSPGERWCCLFARLGDELVGALPLVIRSERRSVVAATPADDHTPSVEPTVAPGLEGAVIPALLAAAFQHLPGCVRVDLRRLPVESPALELARAGQLGRPSVVSLAAFGAYLPVEGAFADFRTALSRNFRNNISKAANKLAKTEGVEVVFKSAAEATADDLRAFLEVEASSWKGERGTAILKSPEETAFYTTLTERLGAAGWLEWQFLRAEGKVIAANLAVALGPELVIWKLGYDPEHRHMSPGTLLMEKVVMRAFEAHGASGGEINLLTSYDWYDNWQMRRRRYETLRVYSNRLLPRLVHYLPRKLEQTARDTPLIIDTLRRARARLRTWRRPPPAAE